MRYPHALIFLAVALFAVPNMIHAEEIMTPLIKVFESDSFNEILTFEPFPGDSQIHSIDIEMADINKDSRSEFIVAAGGDSTPLIRIFSEQGVLIREFLAYAENFRGGVHITAADIDGDGVTEIISAAQNGGGPHVRIFDNYGNSEGGFFAFGHDLRGGVNLGVGELHPMDGLEIVAASGRGMDPLIRVYNRYGDLLYEFEPDFPEIKYGLNVSVVDLEQDGQSEIIVTAKHGYDPVAKIYTPDGLLIKEFRAYQKSFKGGVNLDFAQLHDDPGYEIITGASFGGGSHVRFFNSNAEPIIKPDFFVFEDFGGGVLVESGNTTDSHKGNEIITATQFNPLPGKDKNYQMIEVDLAAQELVTYEFGRERDRSLVSSGLWKYPTPTGSFKVEKKIPEKAYVWSYGPQHPDNYELTGVRDNLMFKWPFYLHGAYWHNNFGNRMSHGCVNLPLDYAEKLYAWADVGASVDIYANKSTELAAN